MSGTKQLVWPCGCVLWRFGGSEGQNPCQPHLMIHLKMIDRQLVEQHSSSIFSGDLAAVPCDCPLHRAQKLGMRAWDFVVEQSESDRVSNMATLVSDRDVHGDLEIGCDPCGCCWQKLNTRWRITKVCPNCSDRMSPVREAERNSQDR